jgi:hypothetical protein
MKRVHLSGVALVLAVTTSAWAGVEPYPAAVQVEEASTKTRSEVIAELHEAQRLGLMTSVERDFASARISQESGDTVIVWGDARAMRAKIHAETIEANRLGLLSVGEGNPPVATAEQEELIAAAGRRAVETILGAQSAVQTASK